MLNSKTKTFGPLLMTTLLVAVTTIGCSFHRAFVRYDEIDEEVVIQAESWPGERLGEVRASEGGAIWDDCTEIASRSLWLLVEQAQAMGGNAIGDVRWFTECSPEPIVEPTCERRWGWFVLWPGLLTPAFMGAEVDAVVYRIPSNVETRSDLIVLPEDRAELGKLVDRMADGRVSRKDR